MTVALRPLTAHDTAWLEQWFANVAHSVGYDDDGHRLLALEDSGDARVHVIERGEPAEPVGLIVSTLHAPSKRAARAKPAAIGQRVAIIEFVGTPPGDARRGSGMSAAAALERILMDEGVRTIYAPAPERHGIAVYFWIRLGYRPLLRHEWPCERQGVAWLRRDIT